MKKTWPIYFKDKLILGNPRSQVGIITLWTPVNHLVDSIDKNLYLVAGQLYSRDGINFILRNILANPRLELLILCGAERSGSGQALINFIEKGIDQEYNIIGTENCQIHQEIPQTAIELFRKKVKVVKLLDNDNPQKIVSKIQSVKFSGKFWAKPQVFPEAKIEFEGIMPTDQSVFKIRQKHIGEAWLEILKKIMKFGTIRESFHGNNCRELFNIAAVITNEDPNNFKIFPYFPITKKDIKKYLPNFMTGKKGSVDYTYGERLWNFPQIPGQKYRYNQVDQVMVDFLTRYPTDRAAVASIFGIQDHTAQSAPCMTFVQATNVEEKLDLTAYFRSHDIFGGWLLNAFGLRTFQKYIAGKLKMPLGNLTIYSNCAHIYDNNWKRVQEIIKKYGDILDCTSDPRGYLIIDIKNDDIIIKHISPNGKFLQEFRQNGKKDKAAMLLYNKLVVADVVSQTSHAFDIGVEIAKAEIAIKQGLKYTQDQPLRFQ